jgi:hypothetical protein
VSDAARFRCFACGRFTDEAVDEGPTPGEAGQACRWTTGVLEVEGTGEDKWRAAVACWPCFWKTDPDMWIGAGTWDSLDPKVPFARLPSLQRGRGGPEAYPWPT